MKCLTLTSSLQRRGLSLSEPLASPNEGGLSGADRVSRTTIARHPDDDEFGFTSLINPIPLPYTGTPSLSTLPFFSTPTFVFNALLCDSLFSFSSNLILVETGLWNETFPESVVSIHLDLINSLRKKLEL